MKKNILNVFTISINVSFVICFIMWVYVGCIKNNNGTIDTQPNTTEFVKKYTVSKYLVFCFWTAGSENNIMPGTDEYYSGSDTIASIIGFFMTIFWIGIMVCLYYLSIDKKTYSAPGLLTFMLIFIIWFWYNTIKMWPIISNFVH